MTKSQVPKYMVLKAQIMDWALNGQIRPGEQIPTESQLSEQFHMSRQTVRLAINELVYENVLYRRQGKGTFVAESFLQRQASNVSHHMIAVITTYISDYIFPSIIRGIESRLSDAKYSMLLLSTDNDFEKEAKALENILQRPIDGVILEPTKSSRSNPNLRRYLSLISKQVPLVMLHSSYEELAVPCVRMDDEQGGYIAAEHLLELGHTRIGAILKTDDVQGKLRMRGLIRAHQVSNVPIRPEWIEFYSTEERVRVAQQYVDSFVKSSDMGRPTAIVCYNDDLAADIMKYLNDANIRVPDDISVVSFDDSQWAQSTGCTSVEHPKYEMGLEVADYILKSIEGEPSTKAKQIRDRVFESKLVVRTSTRDMRIETESD